MALSLLDHLFRPILSAQIEANRISDCERFLRTKKKDYTIIDPKKNNSHGKWRESSRDAKLKYWNDVMTLQEKRDMQNKRANDLKPHAHTEVIDI